QSFRRVHRDIAQVIVNRKLFRAEFTIEETPDNACDLDCAVEYAGPKMNDVVAFQLQELRDRVHGVTDVEKIQLGSGVQIAAGADKSPGGDAFVERAGLARGLFAIRSVNRRRAARAGPDFPPD